MLLLSGAHSIVGMGLVLFANAQGKERPPTAQALPQNRVSLEAASEIRFRVGSNDEGEAALEPIEMNARHAALPAHALSSAFLRLLRPTMNQ